MWNAEWKSVELLQNNISIAAECYLIDIYNLPTLYMIIFKMCMCLYIAMNVYVCLYMYICVINDVFNIYIHAFGEYVQAVQKLPKQSVSPYHTLPSSIYSVLHR